MPYDERLAERIRAALHDETDVREVRMFGGLSFLVRNRLTATANRDGDLMVRCDPARTAALLGRAGARPPEMGSRRMSQGWLVVDAGAVESDDVLAAWIAEALARPDAAAARDS
jgi:hypothetical protein